MVGNATFRGLGWGFLGALGFASAIYYGNQLVQKGRENPNKNLTWENVKQFWNENWKEILITSGSVIGGSLAIRESTEEYNPRHLLELDGSVKRILKKLESETPENYNILGVTFDNKHYYVNRKYGKYHVLTQSPELFSAAQEKKKELNISPEEIIIALCDENEKIVYWLEKGNTGSGMIHILLHIEESNQFERIFGKKLTQESLIHWIFMTIINGKEYWDKDKKGRPRRNFIYYLPNSLGKILISGVGTNGYIANFSPKDENTLPSGTITVDDKKKWTNLI